MLLFTRILLVGTILAGLGAIYAGLQLKAKKAELQTSLEKQVADTNTANQKAAAEEQAKQAALAKVQSQTKEIEEVKASAEKVNSDLTSLKSKASETEQKLQAVQQDLAAKQAEIAKYEKALPPGMTIDQVKSKLQELQGQFATLDQEKTILKDQLAKLDAEKRKLDDQLKRRAEGKMPAGLTGHIMAVNHDWNFVILDIGSNDGVVESAPMIVYRDGKLVGKIKITSVEPSIAIADILADWQQVPPQEGDTATF
jgi:multidrug efflux pump subunit AcrA (membrane-fusion protein)